MAYSIPDIITWAKISQPLARYGEARKKANIGGSIDYDLDMKLFITRRDVEYEYAQDPTSDNLFAMGNYLLALCGVYLFAAQAATGSGGSISPVTPAGGSSIFPLVVTGSDFQVDGITYDNPDIVGNNLMLFVANFNNEWQFAPTFFAYSGTGIVITFPGFDANNYSSIIIQNYNP